MLLFTQTQTHNGTDTVQLFSMFPRNKKHKETETTLKSNTHKKPRHSDDAGVSFVYVILYSIMSRLVIPCF